MQQPRAWWLACLTTLIKGVEQRPTFTMTTDGESHPGSHYNYALRVIFTHNCRNLSVSR
jgi:hypothetical protein